MYVNKFWNKKVVSLLNFNILFHLFEAEIDNILFEKVLNKELIENKLNSLCLIQNRDHGYRLVDVQLINNKKLEQQYKYVDYLKYLIYKYLNLIN